MYYGNVSYDFNISTTNWAINKIKVDKLTKQRYDMEENAGLVNGISKESRAKSLISMLQGVKSVKLAKSGSVMDAVIKADVVVELEDGSCGIIQIKSSEAAALEHMSKEYIEYNNDLYDIPGVFWFTKNQTNMEALTEFATWFNLELNADLVAALNLCDKFKAKQFNLPLMAAKRMFTKQIFDWLVFLRKIHVEGNKEVKFL